MSNPWLSIPLQDYEGHMALPHVGQAKMIANELEELLQTYMPSSVAIIGCAGGNGIEEASTAGVARVVGLDINPTYVAEAKVRYSRLIPSLELYCADIEEGTKHVLPVELVYGALVFEYVEVANAMKNLLALCLPGGLFAAILQLTKEGIESVSPSRFVSLKELGSIMRLVPADEFRKIAEELGFERISEKLITIESGKQFSMQVFKLTSQGR